MRAFLLLKLNLMVSVSYWSLPILNTGFPFTPPSAVESAVPLAFTLLLSMSMAMRSLVRSMFWYFTSADP